VTTSPPKRRRPAKASPAPSNVVQFPGADVEQRIATLRADLKGWKPPAHHEWMDFNANPSIPCVQLAYFLIRQSQPDMHDSVARITAQADMADLVDSMTSSADHFAKLSLICSAAADRLQAHSARAARAAKP
jgi:hypothetical protein